MAARRPLCRCGMLREDDPPCCTEFAKRGRFRMRPGRRGSCDALRHAAMAALARAGCRTALSLPARSAAADTACSEAVALSARLLPQPATHRALLAERCPEVFGSYAAQQLSYCGASLVTAVDVLQRILDHQHSDILPYVDPFRPASSAACLISRCTPQSCSGTWWRDQTSGRRPRQGARLATAAATSAAVTMSAMTAGGRRWRADAAPPPPPPPLPGPRRAACWSEAACGEAPNRD